MDMGTINIRILAEKVEDFLYDQLGRERYVVCILREIYNLLLENLDGWPLVPNREIRSWKEKKE